MRINKKGRPQVEPLKLSRGSALRDCRKGWCSVTFLIYWFVVFLHRLAVLGCRFLYFYRVF